MNLGLLDILTAQQVEPKGSHAKSSSDNSPVSDDKKFSSYLKDKDGSESAEPAEASGQDNTNNTGIVNNVFDLGKNILDSVINQFNANPVAQNLVADVPANISALANPDVNIGNVVSGLATTAANSSATDSLSVKQTALTEVFNAVKAAKDKGVGNENNPLSVLLSLQEEGATEVSNLGELVKNIAAPVNETKLDVKSLKEGEIDPAVLSALGINPEQAGQGTGQDITLNDIAGAVIDIAKTKAATPDVSETDVKSDQVSSLLKTAADSKNTQNNVVANQNGAQAQNNANTDAQPDNNANVQTITRSFLDNLAADKDVAGKPSQQAAANATSNINNAVQAANNSSQHSGSDSNLPKQNPDLALNSNVGNNSSGALSTADYIKFQDYIAQAAGNGANANTSRSGDANEIISQIKFGIFSVAGKVEKNITIQLHPKELGSVHVRMEMHSSGKTSVSIMAENVDTLNLLQKEAGSLREMLADALQTNSSELNFSFHEQGNDQWKQMISESFGRNSGIGAIDGMEEEISNFGYNSYMQMTAMDGLDIRV